MLTESGFFKEEPKSNASGSNADAGRISRSSVPPDLVPGRLICNGKYELLRKIGVGAMGEVWAAKHRSLEEEVAIKLVLRDVHHDDGSTADGRFLVEARVARMLSRMTRHIVSVTDHGSDGDMAYLVMELLSGEALDTRLERSGRLPLEKVVPVIKQVARALEVAHGEGIVHRDLKPGNVFLTLSEEGNPLIKILDFGIAKLTTDTPRSSLPADPDSEGRESRLPAEISERLSAHEAKQKTLRGFLLGTPAFMSPEQARGKRLDHRADVWALGVITYHLLTAQFPFDGKDAEELFKRLVRVQPFPITDHRQDLPASIVALFEKAFAKRIEDRFQSADEFAIALDAAAGHRAPVKISVMPPSDPRVTPPPVTLKSPGSAAKKGSTTQSGSLIAAGLPRNDRRRLAVGAVALFALIGAIAFGYGQMGKSDAQGSGLAAGARSSLDTGGATTLTRSDEIIPPPEPVPVAAPESVPVQAPPVNEAPVPPPAAIAAEPEVHAAAAVAAPPPPVAKKPIDRSEVF